MDSPKVRAFIFARGGSKGVPRKNIKLLGGVPLIGHSIRCALASTAFDKVVVSTDDPEIAEIAREFGAEVPFVRPGDLAGDTSAEWLAWRHAVEWYENAGDRFDIMVSLPTTSPFRSVDDVEGCLDLLLSNDDTDAVITVKKAERSPYFNMVRLEQGYASLAVESSTSVGRRQDAPILYDMTTVAYATRVEFIKSSPGFFSGKVRALEIPVERALDIDTPYDFRIAELLMRDNQDG